MRIDVDDLTGADVVAFLEAHVSQLRSMGPPESTHVLDLAGLRSPDVTFWTARDDAARAGSLLGCAALKRLDDEHAELKSMRTTPERRGEGVAGTLLEHVLVHARRVGFTRVSLETGSYGFFAPAHRLYRRHGFEACEPFGDYRHDPLSLFLTLAL